MSNLTEETVRLVIDRAQAPFKGFSFLRGEVLRQQRLHKFEMTVLPVVKLYMAHHARKDRCEVSSDGARITFRFSHLAYPAVIRFQCADQNDRNIEVFVSTPMGKIVQIVSLDYDCLTPSGVMDALEAALVMTLRYVQHQDTSEQAPIQPPHTCAIENHCAACKVVMERHANFSPS